MTKKEALQILAILKAAYPSSYNNMTKEEASGTVAIWAMQFADMPVDIVMMAIHKLISTSKFPPSVAEVKDKIKSIHWEAYDMITVNREYLPEKNVRRFERIYEATKEYKFGTMYEPKLNTMLANDPKLLGGADETN